MTSEKIDLIISKINVKSVSIIISSVLIVSGIYMCFQQISHDGFIDIKSAVLSGKVQSGSLGLLVIFLGVAVILTVVKKSGIKTTPRVEKIELEMGNMKINCENISFRKVQELRELLKEADRTQNQTTIQGPNLANAKSYMTDR